MPNFSKKNRRDFVQSRLLEPFGGVAFNPQRRSDEGQSPSNGERAERGGAAVALHYQLVDGTADRITSLLGYASDVDLTQEPEIPIGDLLVDLMHYCHRQGVAFYGDDGVLPMAQRNFAAESGGAAL